MASVKLMETKDGKRFWRIQVSRGRGLAPYSTRFYWPEKKDGSPVSKRVAESQRDSFVLDYETRCRNGEILTRAEAKKKAEKEAAAAAEEAAKIKTLKQYGEQVFIPAKKVDCAKKTIAYYKSALKNHIYPEFGDHRLPEITSAQLSSFFLKKQTSGLAHSTVLGIYVTLNQLLTMAYFDESISRNPLDKVKRPRQRKNEKTQGVDAFSADEANVILKYAKQEPLKWRTMIYLLLMTGMRRGEACALKWEDIDLQAHRITVKGSIGYTPEDGVFHEQTKTGEQREVYWGNEDAERDVLTEVLKQYRQEQRAAVLRRTERLKKDGKPLEMRKIAMPEYVFTERGAADPIHPDAVNRYFKRFKETYGIEIHAHKLRHTYATIAIANGADIAGVSGNLGHKDINTTFKVYVHPTADGKRKAGELVADSFKLA